MTRESMISRNAGPRMAHYREAVLKASRKELCERTGAKYSAMSAFEGAMSGGAGCLAPYLELSREMGLEEEFWKYARRALLAPHTEHDAYGKGGGEWE